MHGLALFYIKAEKCDYLHNNVITLHLQKSCNMELIGSTNNRPFTPFTSRSSSEEWLETDSQKAYLELSKVNIIGIVYLYE